jgi:hypothetical protein
VLETKTDQERMDSPFEVGWSTWAERESDGKSGSSEARALSGG